MEKKREEKRETIAKKRERERQRETEKRREKRSRERETEKLRSLRCHGDRKSVANFAFELASKQQSPWRKRRPLR